MTSSPVFGTFYISAAHVTAGRISPFRDDDIAVTLDSTTQHVPLYPQIVGTVEQLVELGEAIAAAALKWKAEQPAPPPLPFAAPTPAVVSDRFASTHEPRGAA